MSAVYTTTLGMCDTPDTAGNNTIRGCCCYSGTIEVVHVRTKTWANVNVKLDQLRGEMCSGGSVVVGSKTYTFTEALVTNFTATGRLTQSDPASADMSMTLTIGGDPFDVQLVSKDSTTKLLLITNNVPSTASPRVCSVQAASSSRIDTSGYPIPSDDLAAATSVQVSFTVLALAALLAVVGKF